MERRNTEDQLTLYGQSFASRLLLGTARYDSPSILTDAISAADPAMLTVSVRRQLSGSKDSGQSFWSLLRDTQRVILPNTAGCLTAREAVRTACMARELFQTNLIKLEVMGDEVNLQPDPFGLADAATELVKLGFQVLPYCTEDWVLCRRLMDAGCEALMPWAAPIGTGQGPRNPRALRELRERASLIPLIVDAGIGLPSHACQVMEWGFDGVLLNTAVSRSLEPVRMASAFAEAIKGGRNAFLARPMIVQEIAVARTPGNRPPVHVRVIAIGTSPGPGDCPGLRLFVRRFWYNIAAPARIPIRDQRRRQCAKATSLAPGSSISTCSSLSLSIEADFYEVARKLCFRSSCG